METQRCCIAKVRGCNGPLNQVATHLLPPSTRTLHHPNQIRGLSSKTKRCINAITLSGASLSCVLAVACTLHLQVTRTARASRPHTSRYQFMRNPNAPTGVGSAPTGNVIGGQMSGQEGRLVGKMTERLEPAGADPVLLRMLVKHKPPRVMGASMA